MIEVNLDRLEHSLKTDKLIWLNKEFKHPDKCSYEYFCFFEGCQVGTVVFVGAFYLWTQVQLMN